MTITSWQTVHVTNEANCTCAFISQQVRKNLKRQCRPVEWVVGGKCRQAVVKCAMCSNLTSINVIKSCVFFNQTVYHSKDCLLPCMTNIPLVVCLDTASRWYSQYTTEKVQWLRHHPDKHSLKVWTSAVTLTVNTAVQYFHWTPWRMMIYL